MNAQRVGRHRLGQPGLRYCREIPEVLARLEPTTSRNQHATEPARWRIRPALVFGVAAAASAAVVGGWLATGSTALADILGR
ncbi:hypothetical protein [Fodinicola feengrottensis]|uniref:Uncharacterized protein n=1 Tax=Fodinicola feengrottensis TaxID=435914 RepID=A0ABP4UU76_9ACTN|nr:hypothetical protein [Fodinicola feengrottensis]